MHHPPRFFSVLVMSLVLLCASAVWADTGLGRHKQLYVVPAPNTVVIDGKLNDWDLSGQIEMYVISETKAMQSAKFAVMYDREALYLSGVVRDTTPLMNRQEPQANGGRGWDADACQFRLSLDPAQPYPLTASVWELRAGAPDTRDDIVHLTLWNYTDRNEPCLGMQLGMTYRTPRPEWAPFGIVPAKFYQAKYVKATDGGGYTFEYRIPWSTLGAKKPLKGGDTVGGTVQFNWGAADGLKTAGGAAWAYDVMAGPGFVFQSTACWGKLIFAAKGNVAKELVEAGVPAEKPLPLEFAYDLPADGQITLQLFDEKNLVRRILVAQGDRRAGRNIERWDGLDDHGKPLTPGIYTLKGIIHQPITGKFLFSAHNSGQPPYPTDDGKGGWGADHGDPTGCSAIPGGLLLAWQGAEYGWGIIRVDLEGRKQWGSKTEAKFIVNDGKRFFTYSPPYDPANTAPATGIKAFALADGKPLTFGGGQDELKAPPDGDREGAMVTGLAAANGKIYVSYGKRNLIGVFDGASGKLGATWTVPAPGVLAARPDGSLAVISDGKLVAVAAGKITALNGADLDTPAGITVATDGTIYVSNQGTQQDIAVFSSDGKLLRRIGKAGGRPAMGDYDANGVYMPQGLAVDANGRLWVAENSDGPKRISVWNTATGAFAREFFGGSGYFAYATIDPAVPNELYCHNVLWRVDWEKNTVAPISTIWRKTAPEMVSEPAVSSMPQGFKMLTATNGRQYGIGSAPGASILYRRDGNLFKPFFAAFNVQRRNIPAPWRLDRLGGIPPALDDPEKTPDGRYFWQDANDDQRMQRDELFRFTDLRLIYALGFRALAPDLTIWADGGYLVKPVRWLANGQPVYDPEQLEKSFLFGTPHANADVWLDPDGAVYTLGAGQLSRWRKDGKLEWGYPGIPRWGDSLGLPPVKPGLLHGLTGGLGVAGEFTGNMTYFGPCHLFDRNGIYTGMIFRDGRMGGRGPDEGQPEGHIGSLVRVATKPGAAPRTFLLAGGQDARVTEVLGFDSIKPLPATTFTLSAEGVKTAADALTAYKARTGQGTKLVIAAGRPALDTGKGAEKSLDGARRFTARVAHDDKNLFVRFDVVTPSELVNAVADPKLLFKGGNCLDIQLAADPGADPQRKTPAPGDVRLLVTRQTGKTFAVLYRTKVKEFKGEPIVLISPTGKEAFDAITVVENVGLDYRKTGDGFTVVVTIPLELVGLKLAKDQKIKMDLGYIYGNATGNGGAARSYVFNNSFSANVVNDVPNESRLEPAQWGAAEVE
jgi:hypothetical protein